MSLLDQLWDDTLAGPRPDKGLGKLRKQSTFSFRSSDSGKESAPVTNSPAAEDPAMRVTRSIMIVKPERTNGETPPASPAGSTPPVSPFPDRRHLGFVGNLRQTLTGRQAGLEAGALVLLTTCEM
ncbi:dormancy-associated protein homolog 3 isoform X2 [Helianthus annuus]|uniref:dormancy-associated protein homolog 3 isoform X2 n=1 Tax=Helianthus annuus TaxID=4232 RepID=UPI000B8F3DDF|nr:dormancy-associated protein homolog 3 isoform X2 [Helianthus annuus]